MRSQAKKDAARRERILRHMRIRRRGWHHRWSMAGLEANTMAAMEIRFAHDMAELDRIKGRLKLIADEMGAPLPMLEL
jgi:hypothetical protein